MGVVKLRHNGLIENEDFNKYVLDTRWEKLPNDPARWSLIEVQGALRMKHGADPLFIYFNPLTDIKQFVLDVKNNYKPIEEGDRGGIIVYADNNDFIALEEFFDSVNGTANTYPWIRLVRFYNRYVAYWSDDGKAWNLIGTRHFDRLAPKIGLFLEGTGGDYLDVEQFTVMTDTNITVENISGGTEVRLLDSSGTIIDTKVCRSSSSRVKLNIGQNDFPFRGRFQITLPDGSVFSDNLNYTIWGGDVFSFEIVPDLFYYEENLQEWVLVSTNLEQFLGYLTPEGKGQRDIQMMVVNRHEGTFSDVNLSLASYKGTDHFERLVEIAPDDNGFPGLFGDLIHVGTLNYSQEYLFWLRVHREYDSSKYTTELYFGFDISSQYSY